MRVVFDHQCFQDQAEGGVSRYVTSLVTALRGQSGVDVAGWAGLHQGRAPEFFGGRRTDGRWLEGMGVVSRLTRFANTVGFAAWAHGSAGEVYHATYYRCPRVPSRMARVVTAHDCIHERFPGTGGNEAVLKREAFAQADHIICISECTREDVMRFYGIPEEKLSVVYHGAGYGPRLDMSAAGAMRVSRPYVLYVGTRGGYKNFEVLRRLWASDQGLRAACDLICLGGERDELTVGIPGLRHIVRVSDTELLAWYKGAVALVYPSKYEGFGLPVLEAMSAGCPVLTTRCGAIPEVAGGAACYCDPDDSREWGEAIGRLLTRGGERAEWTAKGLVQARMFSWARCAESTVQVYVKALAARDRRVRRS